MELIYLPVAFACVLYIWHDTDAFVEYLKLFGAKKLFFIEEYEKERDSSEGLMDYNTFLLIYHSNFFVRLVTCAICLSVWFGLVALYFHRDVGAFFLVLWFTWFFYFGIKFIINKSNAN